MSFFQRLKGIFFTPQQTFEALTKKAVWVDILIFLLIISALFQFIIAPYQQKDTLQLWKNNVKLQERMGEESYNKMIERLENPSPTARYIQPFLMIPLALGFGFLISSLLILGLGRLTSTQGNFLLVFSALLHAQLIDKLLGNAVRLVLILMRKSVMQTSTSLALFFPHLETTSFSYIVLSQFDFFQLWLFGILGYGLSSIFKIEVKKGLIISYAFWLLKSIFNIAISLPFLRMMG
ncbi:MAG: hypothetical protein ACE5LC_00050 [Candidatus Aminicenantales bacterium]